MKTCLIFFLVLIFAPNTFGQKTQNPPPCAEANSQAEMNICAGKEYKAADAALNKTYQQLSGMLNEEEKAQLKAAQLAWIKYRDANCDFVADQFKGGSMRPMILGLCLADVTRNRTTELKSQIKDRNN
jgi:uncharacterized protein YecT (DUF1311 family)